MTGTTKTGIVKWFNGQKGFGFIIDNEDQKEYFVYWSDIQMSGFKSLLPEQRVEFEIEKNSAKGDKAINVKKI